MPKRISKFMSVVLVLVLALNLSGCFFNSSVLAIDQTLPQTPKLDLAPYWIFDTAYSLDPNNQEIDGAYFKGLGAFLSKELVQIGTDSVRNPVMKVMNVRTYEYFLTRYKIAPRQVGLTDARIAVYTITDAKGFSARIYRINDDRIALERNNILLYFNRAQDLKETGLAVSTDAQGNPSKPPASNANGVLIGLRGARKTDENGVLGPAPYRTLWISLKRGQPLEVFEVPDILFPRNVFYQLKIERQENIEVVRETISIKNLSDGSTTRENTPPDGLSRFSDITFISNDYLSVASREAPEKGEGAMQLYSTRSVNNLNYENRVRLTDLFGPEGINVLESAANVARANAKPAETTGLGELTDDSFILKRLSGRWIYEARINSLEEYSSNNLTFPMNFRDNLRVYRYDALVPGWSDIRQVVPDAKDAVSSPDNFFTVVKTKNKLLVLAKNPNGTLAFEPLAQIDLKDEDIIMHEWALGSYVDDWGTMVRSLGPKIR